MNVKVSVIVPVYNTEKYLPQCIESLLNQTLKECEFIFVNDGSNDRCMEILERYKEQDERIRLINQVNSGVSSARNTGLVVAEGEYIGFVDADDYVENSMFETLYTIASQSGCDIVVSNFESFINGGQIIIGYPFPQNIVIYRDLIENTILPYFIKEDKLNSVCNKIFKSNIIKDYKLRFPKNLSLGEDGIFNIHYLTYAEAVTFIDYCGYHYREVEGSATRNILKKDYFHRVLEVYHSDLPEIYKRIMDIEQIEKLKSIKLIKNVITLIHVYLTPSSDLKFLRRVRYVKSIVKSPIVIRILTKFQYESFEEFGRYEKFIINMILKRSLIGLYLATAYSRYRNRETGEIIG